MKKIKKIAIMIKKLIVFLTIFILIISIPFLIAFEAWDIIRYILYFVALAVYIQIHKAIIKNPKFEWYRWLVNSFLYRWHIFLFKQTFKKFTYSQKTQYHTDRIIQIENNTMWFDKYWFGRGLQNELTNEMIKAHRENGLNLR